MRNINTEKQKGMAIAKENRNCTLTLSEIKQIIDDSNGNTFDAIATAFHAGVSMGHDSKAKDFYTESEWDEMTPTQKEAAWDKGLDSMKYW